MSMTAHRSPLPRIVAQFFGAGLSPRAPGTVGTLAAIPLYLLLTLAGPVGYTVLTVLLVILGIRLCGLAAEELGTRLGEAMS